jgi:hypothetical protein
MAINRADVERADRAAAGAVNVKPRHAGHEGGADRRRPPHVASSRDLLVPAHDHTPRLSDRGLGFGVGSPFRDRVGEARSVPIG